MYLLAHKSPRCVMYLLARKSPRCVMYVPASMQENLVYCSLKVGEVRGFIGIIKFLKTS